MNIAIIGGGFYGCYFAYKLSKKHKITIFEKNQTLFAQAGLYNQYRLHQGFHYPRSLKTINQTYKGYIKFKKEFSDFLYFPKNNFYIIHKDSKITFKKYLSKYNKKFGYKKIDLNKIKNLKNLDQFEGAINTKEGVILMNKLSKFLIRKVKKNCNVNFNKEIKKIDSNKGLVFDNKNSLKFDRIINTTYTNPNLGLNKKVFNLKYELAALLIPNKKIKNIHGITIMDGDFVSLYPRNRNTFSVSSVRYTPVKKFNKKDLIKKKLKEFTKIEKKNFVKKKIIEHFKKYINIKLDKNSANLEFAIKTKIINDIGEIRTANYIKNKKLISILCGKLDAAPIIYDKIKNKLK